MADQEGPLRANLKHTTQGRATLHPRYLPQDSDPSLSPEHFCIWIKNLLDEAHPSSLNEAIKAIHLFTAKESLSSKETNCFMGFLVEKSAALNINTGKFEAILENCSGTQDTAMGLILELVKYAESKNNKVSLFSLKGLKSIVDRHPLTDKRYINTLFEIGTRVLEGSMLKEMRDVGMQLMAVIIGYLTEPFDVICETKFKKVRPIVLKELKGMLKSNRLRSEEESREVRQEVDLKSLAPTKLFYLNTVTNCNEKKSILLEFEQNLEKVVLNGDFFIKRDYYQVYNVVESLLEENNQVIVSCATKILKLILRSHGACVPDSTWRRLFNLICDKYKGAKSHNFNQQMHKVITCFWECRDYQPELFVESSFEAIEKGKNNNARLGIIDWWTTEYPPIFEARKDSKLKAINLEIKGRIERSRNQKFYQGVSAEIEGFFLTINNIETRENRVDTRGEDRKLKTMDEERTKPKQKDVLSFTQAMKITAEKSVLRESKSKERSFTQN